MCVSNHWDCKSWCSIDGYIKEKEKERRNFSKQKTSKWFWSRIVFAVMLNFEEFCFENWCYRVHTVFISEFYSSSSSLEYSIQTDFSSLSLYSLFLLYRLIRIRIWVSVFMSKCFTSINKFLSFFFFACGNRLWYNDAADDNNNNINIDDDDDDDYDNIENLKTWNSIYSGIIVVNYLSLRIQMFKKAEKPSKRVWAFVHERIFLFLFIRKNSIVK